MIPLLIFKGLLSQLNLRWLSRVKNEFLEVPPIDKFLELFSEGPTVDCVMAHHVIESTIIAGSGALRG